MPLSILDISKGEIKYKLSYLTATDKLADDVLDTRTAVLNIGNLQAYSKLPFLILVVRIEFEYVCGGIGSKS